MKFYPTPIAGVFSIEPEPIVDARGFFARTFCEREFEVATGRKLSFVQMNQSRSLQKGTFRGLHYQLPPKAETKLIRCVRGAVLDFALDLRKDSPTFLQWTSVEMSAENMRMILIPEGFAHAFQSLEENSEMLYHHTEFFAPAYDRGVRYNDPRIAAMHLPLPISVMSEKDRNYEFLSNDFEGITL